MSFSFCPVCAAWTLSRRPRDPGIRNVLVTLAFVVDRGCACGGYLAIAPSPPGPPTPKPAMETIETVENNKTRFPRVPTVFHSPYD